MSDQMKPEFPTLEQVIFWYAYKRQKINNLSRPRMHLS